VKVAVRLDSLGVEEDIGSESFSDKVKTKNQQ
jgi:hypothetical protein